MSRSGSRLIAAVAFALALALAAPSNAQRVRGDEGTGGAAGYSPPIDMPAGGAAPMDAPSPSTEMPADAPAAPEAMPDAMGAPPPDESQQKEENAPPAEGGAPDATDSGSQPNK